NRLIEDLVTFYRLTEKQMSMGEVPMNDLVQTVTQEQLRMQQISKNVQLKIEPLPAAYGDFYLLRLLFSHLIGNALKFSKQEEQPQLEIQGTTKPGETVYVIRDNGIGFDMQYANKLFQVFQKLQKNDEFEGNGIGLAAAKKIVEKHGGQISIDSKPGNGTAVTVSLPVKAA
ncbi:MAG: ATP-binding protein, partial [Verrucomicrobiota bacterium]|nr:ATP-binding protein [Verrucomicrobiota bacterium]